MLFPIVTILGILCLILLICKRVLSPTAERVRKLFIFRAWLEVARRNLGILTTSTFISTIVVLGIAYISQLGSKNFWALAAFFFITLVVTNGCISLRAKGQIWEEVMRCLPKLTVSMIEAVDQGKMHLQLGTSVKQWEEKQLQKSIENPYFKYYEFYREFRTFFYESILPEIQHLLEALEKSLSKGLLINVSLGRARLSSLRLRLLKCKGFCRFQCK